MNRAKQQELAYKTGVIVARMIGRDAMTQLAEEIRRALQSANGALEIGGEDVVCYLNGAQDALAGEVAA